MNEALNWYKKLTPNQKINLRDIAVDLVGITWEQMGLLFSVKERINILHNKLKIEGFNV
jgi:hypothetical protein